jgi:hypothetical protein
MYALENFEGFILVSVKGVLKARLQRKEDVKAVEPCFLRDEGGLSPSKSSKNGRKNLEVRRSRRLLPNEIVVVIAIVVFKGRNL